MHMIRSICLFFAVFSQCVHIYRKDENEFCSKSDTPIAKFNGEILLIKLELRKSGQEQSVEGRESFHPSAEMFEVFVAFIVTF